MYVDAYRKYIEESLNEIKTTIQPKFGSKNDGPKPVSKEKLLRLWMTKQKRAIQIIKDGNVVCPQIECTLENDKIYSYFNRKAGNSYETSDKEKPSWMIDYEPPETYPSTCDENFPSFGQVLHFVVSLI